MTGTWAALAVLTAVMACKDDASDSGDTAGETEAIEPSSVSLTWGVEDLTIDISTDGPGGYWFGIVDSRDGCDAKEDGCWTGEDCYQGDALGDGTQVEYCHDAANGGSTALTYGGDPADLFERSETAIDATFEEAVTLFLYSDEDWHGNGSCWVWGVESDHYDALGCTWMEGWGD